MNHKAALKNLFDLELPETVSDCHVLVRLQQKAIEELSLRIDRLELENGLLKEQLATNSQNSSLPPSKDRKKKKPSKGNSHSSGRPSGGQVGHRGHFRALVNVEEVDQVVKCELPGQCDCGGEIESSEAYQRHQVYELPEIQLHLTEYQLMKGRCRCCRQNHVASLPEGVSGGITGSRLTSLMSLLVSQYQLSRRGVQVLLKEYFHFEISLGTLFNKQRLVTEVLKEPVAALLESIQGSGVVHSDETSHREQGERSWMWTLATGQMAYFEVMKSRGKKAFHHLLGSFEGILISDRYSVYDGVCSSHRQLCWSHLKRDFTRLSEKSEPTLARIGKALLAEKKALFQAWYEFKQGQIGREALVNQCNPIRRRIGEYLEQGTYTDPALRAARFCQNLLKHFDALWTFLSVEGVEPTNNAAERCLRPWVIWRKKYFGTRSTYGSEYVARTASLIMTTKLNRKNPFDYLALAIQNHFSSLRPPPLLPFLNSS